MRTREFCQFGHHIVQNNCEARDGVRCALHPARRTYRRSIALMLRQHYQCTIQWPRRQPEQERMTHGTDTDKPCGSEGDTIRT